MIKNNVIAGGKKLFGRKVAYYFLIRTYTFVFFRIASNSVCKSKANIIEVLCNAQRTKKALMRSADYTGPDQPAHLCRLIRAFVVRLQNQWIL